MDFSSFQHLLPDRERLMLMSECVELFTASSRKKNSAYSEGQTFWTPADEKDPRLAIECFAIELFDRHTLGMEFDRSNSGVEWWPLVIESDADVGAHFDKDYGAEDSGLDLYPHFGTVTYLSGRWGAPTMFLECLEEGALPREIPRAWLSFVQEGKHVRFDGRFLHCASSSMRLRPAASSGAECRVTLLVNIWLNHKPMDCVRVDYTTDSHAARAKDWTPLIWPKEDVLPVVSSGSDGNSLIMPLDKKRQLRVVVPPNVDMSCTLHFTEHCCVFEKREKKGKGKKDGGRKKKGKEKEKGKKKK